MNILDFNSLFNDLFDFENFSSFLRTKETDKAFLVAIDMPGVKEKDLEITPQGDLLLIKAKRKSEFSESFQNVSRNFSIPLNVDREKIQGHLEDGVLKLTLPKEEVKKASKVKIGESNKKWWE